MKFTAAVIQMSADIGNRSANVQRAKALIRAAAQKGSKLCVLPELALDEFFSQWKDTKYFDYAEPLDGPTIREFQALARETDCYLAVPHFERGPMGNCFNSAVLLSGEGELVGVYRKNHIPFTRTYEKYYFTPGGGFPVFESPFGKLGILICYDRRFPESARELVKRGAEIILIPISSMRFAGSSFSELPIWEPELRIRATENQCFVLASNRSGKEESYEFIGNSMIVSPAGEVLAKAGEEENVVVLAEIDTDLVAATRRSLPLMRDRRTDLY